MAYAGVIPSGIQAIIMLFIQLFGENNCFPWLLWQLFLIFLIIQRPRIPNKKLSQKKMDAL